MNLVTIQLEQGNTYFLDQSNSIFLSTKNPTATIDTDTEKCDLSIIKKAIAKDKISVLKGKLYNNSTHKFDPIFYGIEDKIISVGDNFNMLEGVKVMSYSENLTNNLKVEGLVNTQVPGQYKLKYTVSDKANNVATAIRTITVADKTAPEIKGADDKSIEQNSAFDPRAGVTATDNVDGDVTSKIQVTIKNPSNAAVESVDTKVLGKYVLTYTVADKANNTGTKVRNITVVAPADKTAPVFKGVEDKEIAVGDTFDPMTGVTATDNVDGDVTSKIQVALNQE